MTEDGRGTNRRAWKAFQVEYDDVMRRSDRLCCYCLSDQQIAVLLSMATYISWPSRWVSDSITVSKDFTQEFSAKLEKQLMSGCADENTPIQYRYSSTGILQRSFNGGSSWSDCPEYDTRNYSVQFPPMIGTDDATKRCLAAAGAVALIKEQVGDQLTDGMSRASLENLIKSWVQTFLQSSNVFVALVTVITNLVFGLVIATLRAALTTESYNALECAFYCNIGDDVTVSDAQYAAIKSSISADISGIAGAFFGHLVYLLGKRGVENLLRAGGATSGDCSECTECAETRVFFTNNSAGTVEVFPDGEGVYTVTCDNFASGGYYGNLSFYDPTVGDDFTKCGQFNILSATGGGLSVKLDCNTGTPNTLSTCYALYQHYWSSPFTLTFTISGCAS